MLESVLLGTAFVWAYWSTFFELFQSWNRDSENAHGFFVLPVAALILWCRRNRLPVSWSGPSWGGLALLGASVGIRIAGAVLYSPSLDGCSLVLWIWGVVWLLGGWRRFVWSLPALVFLLFVVPLPPGSQRWLAQPLAGVVAQTSCFLLQCCGLPVLLDGNAILMGEDRLEVLRTFSGLQSMMGIAAVAMAYLFSSARPWWEKVLLIGSVPVVALAAISLRIVLLGITQALAENAGLRGLWEELAGWSAVPAAALFFAAASWYFSRLLVEVETVGVRELVLRERV